MSTVSFTVLYLTPPSGNHYKSPCRYTGRDGHSHMGFKLTKAAKAYYDATAIFARGQSVAPASDSERRTVRYLVKMDVYLAEKQRGDADNFLKCGLDALVNCGVIHSDANVFRCVASVHKNQRTNPRTEYHIERLKEDHP
jgi:Holliday junction resolvase RusA-like endonuclease